MRKSIHIATFLAAFGLLAFCEEPAAKPADPIVPAVRTETSSKVEPPPAPQNTVFKTCAVKANVSARGKGVKTKTAQTPASCRQQCGSDNLCYQCCLHPSPKNCF
jgi:hypothetical protein